MKVMRMNLGKKIIWGTSIAISILVVLSLLFLDRVLRDSITVRLEQNLKNSRVILERFLEDRVHTLFLTTRVVAESPRFKSVITTPDVDHETVLYTLKEIQEIVGSDILTVTDQKGIVLARTSDPLHYGDDLSHDDSIKRVLEGKETAILRVQENRLHLLAAMPAVSDDRVHGALIVGTVIDRKFAERFYEMTGSDIGFMSKGAVIVCSGSESEESALRGLAAGHAAELRSAAEEHRIIGPLTLSQGGEKRLVMIVPLDKRINSDKTVYVLQISLTKAMAIYYDRVRGFLILTGLLAILMAVIANALIARRIIRPLVELTEAAEQISRGDLTRTVRVRTSDEIGKLGGTFNRMIQQLATMRDDLMAAKEQLEQKVLVRTEELAETNRRLQESVTHLGHRNRDMALLSEMDDVLQACYAVGELYTAVARIAQKMLPGWLGFMAIIRPTPQPVDIVSLWNCPAESKIGEFGPEACIALRRGRMQFIQDVATADIVCLHLPEPKPSAYVCVPLVVGTATLGLLHLAPPRSESLSEDHRRFIGTVAHHVSLALANLGLREKLEIESIRDPLTGLFNRRYMEEALKTELARAQRNKTTFVYLMMDLDGFKPVNDKEGHDAGDALLREIAQCISKRHRQGDIVCRFGGDEFTLIMPDTDLAMAQKRAEELLKDVHSLRVMYGRKLIPTVGISIGISAYPHHGSDIHSILLAADEAMYQAKHQGANRVIIAPIVDNSKAPGSE